jgi:hypothetical protein
MRHVFEQPVCQPHPDYDAGLGGRIIKHKDETTLAQYLTSITSSGAIIEHCPVDEIPFISIPGHYARFNIFGAHAQSDLYRYRMHTKEEWTYVLLWESLS